MARNGWGRNQAEAYAARLLPTEVAAIAKVQLSPEHAVAARRVFDAITDAVQKRQAAAAQQKAQAAAASSKRKQ